MGAGRALDANKGGQHPICFALAHGKILWNEQAIKKSMPWDYGAADGQQQANPKRHYEAIWRAEAFILIRMLVCCEQGADQEKLTNAERRSALDWSASM